MIRRLLTRCALLVADVHASRLTRYGRMMGEHARLAVRVDALERRVAELEAGVDVDGPPSDAENTAIARSEAARALLDALAMPSGRSVRAAWERMCLLYGRFGATMMRSAFELYLDELARSES